jgi:hypothetical protein
VSERIERIPGARWRLLAEHGHISLTIAHYGDILEALVAGS